ncbi:MAG: hypothetical protein KA715_05215 [Xanthomonadaceae bacterium]|nr:hypothetical protein [Xanthomonadaceae bacterium]
MIEQATELKSGSIKRSTVANIKAQLQYIYENAKKGDQALIHIQTHGSQAPHTWAIDGQYINAEEFKPLLKKIADKK